MSRKLMLTRPSGLIVPAYGSAAAQTNAGGTTAVTKAALGTPAEGDLLLAFCWSNAGVGPCTWTPPAGEGWVSDAADTSAAVTSAMFHRPALASEPTSWTFTRSQTGNAGGVVLVRLLARRFNLASPVAASNVSPTTTTALATLASLAAANPKSLLLQIVSITSANAAVWTPPGTATVRLAAVAGGTLTQFAVGDETLAAAGAAGTRAWSHTISSASRGGIVALNPAA